jgi:hypothetical protein
MPDSPSTPRARAAARRCDHTRVSVTYTVNAEEGRCHTMHGLKMMREHARPVLVQDLVYDLAVICEDVLTGRRSMRSRAKNVVRLSFERPTARREAYRDLLAAV